MGGVYAVKPLGVYAMVDDGEVDWKVVCIRADDPKAGAVHDVEVRARRVGLGWLGRVWFLCGRGARGRRAWVGCAARRIPTSIHALSRLGSEP